MGSQQGLHEHNPWKDGVPLIRAEGLLLIMDTPKGRGVFAGRDIAANTLIEVSPVLVLDPMENDRHIRKTDLYHYTYNWPYQEYRERHSHPKDATRPSTTQAIILGLGSLFNHSTFAQNVGWIRDIPNRLISYKTLRDVKYGEELCISYGDRLTFADADRPGSDDDEDSGILSRIDIF